MLDHGLADSEICTNEQKHLFHLFFVIFFIFFTLFILFLLPSTSSFLRLSFLLPASRPHFYSLAHCILPVFFAM